MRFREVSLILCLILDLNKMKHQISYDLAKKKEMWTERMTFELFPFVLVLIFHVIFLFHLMFSNFFSYENGWVAIVYFRNQTELCSS